MRAQKFKPCSVVELQLDPGEALNMWVPCVGFGWIPFIWILAQLPQDSMDSYSNIRFLGSKTILYRIFGLF